MLATFTLCTTGIRRSTLGNKLRARHLAYVQLLTTKNNFQQEKSEPKCTWFKLYMLASNLYTQLKQINCLQMYGLKHTLPQAHPVSAMPHHQQDVNLICSSLSHDTLLYSIYKNLLRRNLQLQAITFISTLPQSHIQTPVIIFTVLSTICTKAVLLYKHPIAESDDAFLDMNPLVIKHTHCF